MLNLYQFLNCFGSFEKNFQFRLMVRILENSERFVDQLIYSNGLCFKIFEINHAQYRFKAGLNRSLLRPHCPLEEKNSTEIKQAIGFRRSGVVNLPLKLGGHRM